MPHFPLVSVDSTLSCIGSHAYTGFSLRMLVAEERCNHTGEYCEEAPRLNEK